MGLSCVRHYAKYFHGSFSLIVRRIQREGGSTQQAAPKPGFPFLLAITAPLFFTVFTIPVAKSSEKLIPSPAPGKRPWLVSVSNPLSYLLLIQDGHILPWKAVTQEELEVLIWGFLGKVSLTSQSKHQGKWPCHAGNCSSHLGTISWKV